MNRALSIYLDAVRFLAALLVFFSHACLPVLNGAWLIPVGQYGRDAVMVFFVLSGYVIAHVTSRQERTAAVYAKSRFARLYSVVLPGLLLTVVADHLGRAISPGIYAGGIYEGSHPVLRFLANLLFVNEYWFESLRPFTNGPFWSLSYEAAYYALFGIWMFCPRSGRWLAGGIAMVVVGPKILLLFPIWLLGVGTYRLNQELKLTSKAGWGLFPGSIAAYAAFHYFDCGKLLLDYSRAVLGEDLVMGDLKYSKFFLSGYCVGLLVAINFIGFNALADSLREPLMKIERPVRFLAGFTFSLYLYHYPLLHFFRTLTDNSPAITGMSLLLIFVLGTFTEKKKDFFKRIFDWVFATASLHIPRLLANLHLSKSASG